MLIGSTGYVGSHISNYLEFDVKVHRSDIHTIKGVNTDFLLCAGLPAAKWSANRHPEEDRENIDYLALNLATVSAKRALLISTIDVYQPPIDVTEKAKPNRDGLEAYGANRAQFESFFLEKFPGGKIMRLPGLFSKSLRKNLIYDLLNNRAEQLGSYSSDSEFQYMNLDHLYTLIQRFLDSDVNCVNICSEPVKAGDIAALFNQTLNREKSPIFYNVKTEYAHLFGFPGNYLYNRKSILAEIDSLKECYQLP